MLKIRLSRFGRKKFPSYRLIVSEHTKDTQGDALEYVGNYNPKAQPKTVTLNVERIKYWLSKGVGLSPTVHNLFVSQGVINEKKVQAFKLTKTATPPSAANEPAKPAADVGIRRGGSEEPTVAPVAETPAVEETPAEPVAAPVVETPKE